MSSVLDIIGPVMIGPSSSHTAGAVRLGRIARELLAVEPVRAEVTLYGSFAKTYRGHGTDRALAAGIMGMAADDARLRGSLDFARERNLEITFTPSDTAVDHPNTALIHLDGAGGEHVEVLGSSVGGGQIVVTRIDGLAVRVTGLRTTFIVLHRDAPGLIAAVTDVLAESGANICDFSLARERRGGEAVMTIEVEGDLDDRVERRIKRLRDVTASIMLRPV